MLFSISNNLQFERNINYEVVMVYSPTDKKKNYAVENGAPGLVTILRVHLPQIYLHHVAPHWPYNYTDNSFEKLEQTL